MAVAGCVLQEKRDYVDRMDNLNKYWNKQNQLVKAFGTAETDLAKSQINQLVFRHFEGKNWSI